MAQYQQQGGIACSPNSTVTAALANQRYAVRLDPATETDLNENPTVALTQATADSDEVFGEYQTHDNGTVLVRNTGVVILRASAAYAQAVNGQGVRSSATAGVVSAAGLENGVGRIIGGGTENIGGSDVNVYRVLLGTR